jgi:preprotein translocase subunit SecE
VSRSRIAAAPAEATPDPLEHAAPDVELADAQVALGRPDMIDAGDAEEAEEEYELQAADADGGIGDGGHVPIATGGSGGHDESPAGAGAIALEQPRRGAAAEQRVSLLARLIGFLQGSWRELQRVQWPDRRQVAQATSVVIGFVIVAGVFLGVSDHAFSHLMNYILNGK